MKHLIFAVRDRLAEIYGNPFMQATTSAAIRTFSDSVNSVGDTNMLNKHADDFDLFQLGTWDDNTGLYETGVPTRVAVGKECLRKVHDFVSDDRPWKEGGNGVQLPLGKSA